MVLCLLLLSSSSSAVGAFSVAPVIRSCTDHANSIQFSHHGSSLLSSPFGEIPRNKPRREKKNKYAKTSEPVKDPLEILMEESAQKLLELEQSQISNTFHDVPMEEIQAVKSQPRNFVFPDNKDIDPDEPSTFGFVEIGTVVGPHGVYGEVKIKSSSGFPKRFTERGVRYFKPLNKRAPRKVYLVTGRPTKGDEYIIQLDSAQNREEAARLRGGTLFVREEERDEGTKETDTKSSTGDNKERTEDENEKEEEEEEYFISDLVGLNVFLEPENNDDTKEDDSFVGTVAGVVLSELPGIGHDMLELNLPRGKGGTESALDERVLIPFVPQIVPRVLISERSIYILPPAGLLDLTYVIEEKVRIKGFLPAGADNH